MLAGWRWKTSGGYFQHLCSFFFFFGLRNGVTNPHLPFPFTFGLRSFDDNTSTSTSTSTETNKQTFSQFPSRRHAHISTVHMEITGKTIYQKPHGPWHRYGIWGVLSLRYFPRPPCGICCPLLSSFPRGRQGNRQKKVP